MKDRNKKILLFSCSLFFVLSCVLCGCNENFKTKHQSYEQTVNVCIENEKNIQNQEETVENEVASWYLATIGEYCVVEIEEINENDTFIYGETQFVCSSVNVVLYYSENEKVIDVSSLYIPFEDVNSISCGDVVFAEIGNIWEYCVINKTNGELCVLPIVGEKLVFTDQFVVTDTYGVFIEYNEAVLRYETAMKEGKQYFMDFDSVTFHNGMSIVEINDFFIALKKANRNYREYLNKMEDICNVDLGYYW